jgi:hypothetical protein
VKILPGTESVVDWGVEVGRQRVGEQSDLTLKEYIARLEKIKRSVKRHSAAGPRGYYEFVRDYV